jgi:ATP-dependent helicase/nuclease subunit A
LQHLDVIGLSEADCEARYSSCRRWLAARGVPAALLDLAARRAIDAITRVAAHERGRWIFSPSHTESQKEFALSISSDGAITRVVFDRSFVDASGVRWVIDYKTSLHTGGELDRFLDNEVLRYQPQMNRYAAAAARLGREPIRLGLYFPLMQAWREWEA